MSALFDLPESADEEPARWTERAMLDLLHDRYSTDHGNGSRYVLAEHVRNQGGFGGVWGPIVDGKRTLLPLRTADAIAIDLWPSSEHVIHGFEVKVSRSDWLTELRDPDKADAFKPYVDHWWLVVPDAAIVRNDLPRGWGLLAIGKDGRLRVKKRAPKLDRQPMPIGMTAAWIRATAKTATRRQP